MYVPLTTCFFCPPPVFSACFSWPPTHFSYHPFYIYAECNITYWINLITIIFSIIFLFFSTCSLFLRCENFLNSLKLMQSLVIVWQTPANIHQTFGGRLVDNHWTNLSSHCPPNIWRTFTGVQWTMWGTVKYCYIESSVASLDVKIKIVLRG